MRELTDVYLALDERANHRERLTVRLPAPGRWALLRRRLKTRRTLLLLDDQQLLDVGLTREQALVEARRPFWQLLF